MSITVKISDPAGYYEYLKSQEKVKQDRIQQMSETLKKETEALSSIRADLTTVAAALHQSATGENRNWKKVAPDFGKTWFERIKYAFDVVGNSPLTSRQVYEVLKASGYKGDEKESINRIAADLKQQFDRGKVGRDKNKAGEFQYRIIIEKSRDAVDDVSHQNEKSGVAAPL